MAINPHFDENLLVWKDEYSGRYQPPPTTYSDQFELQWKLALDDKTFYDYSGASIDNDDIDNRICEWTGIHPKGREHRDKMAEFDNMILDHPVNPDLIKGKNCIDIGCGMGRWSKVMLSLGAKSVLSVDMSESALKSVSSFNKNTRRVDVMNLISDCPDLVGQFDFANLWGVAMCTHDPLRAFMNAVSTVKQGGTFYLMVYAPKGVHGMKMTNIQRRTFHGLSTLEERLAYIEHVRSRRWDKTYPWVDNIKNLTRNALNRPRSSKIGTLDLLEPFYNWVIPLDVIYEWMSKAGFQKIQWLNDYKFNHTRTKTAYHVLGTDRRV